MQVEIAGVVDEATRWAIADDLEAVLADVRATVVDYELMKAKAERIAQDIARSPVGAAQAAEVSAFLSWLADRNFTFLGYREYRIENEVLSILPGSGLGLLRDEEYLVFDGLRNLAAMSPGLKPFMESQEVLMGLQVHPAVHRASPGTDGHNQHQNLQRCRLGGRAEAVSRPVHVPVLHAAPAIRSHSAAQGEACH